jgi:crotonobetainyl-CoA:carnitine CoA-transferase CaiB-like acyl-CoA transferase
VPSSLQDLRVLDLSRVLAGPLATMLLGDLGADVIKVERPVTGDDTRAWGPPFDESGEATYFASVNRNKRSITLDLTDERDIERARELALGADVLVENFRPGVMDRAGLGYEQLADDNPRLVYCSITGFGRSAGRDLPGYDLVLQAVGGLMSITGDPDGEPQKVGVALVDVLAGLFATVGVLAALRHRETTGRGQLVETNLMSVLLASLANQAACFTITGTVPERVGNAHPSIAPYELLSCSDGELVLAVGNDRQFAALCEVLGAPSMARDGRFATNAARVRHRDALRGELVRLLRSRAASEWARELGRARVPAGVVNDIGQAFALASSLDLDPIVGIARDDGSVLGLPRNPLTLSDAPVEYRRAPPPLRARGDDEGLTWTTASGQREGQEAMRSRRRGDLHDGIGSA